MYSLLHNFLSDKKGGEIFTLFSVWHFIYIALTLAIVIAVLLVLKNKSEQTKKAAPKVFLNIAFGLYVADLFLMPLAYGEIDIEKLPFHACTAMCITCFLSYRVKFLEKFRPSFVLLGLISNMVYLIYPAGIMWHAVHPLSYRVIQTLSFHSIMTVFGLLYVIFERDKLHIRKCYLDLAVTACMTAWALLGNYAYNGTSDGYSHFFNWFFVIRDPFYAIPENVSPFIMPFINISLFFGVEIFLLLIIEAAKHVESKCKLKT